MTYADGTVYVGMWKEHMRHGAGKLYFENGACKTGKWFYGEYKRKKR